MIIFVQWLVGITGFRMTYKVIVFFHMIIKNVCTVINDVNVLSEKNL